MLNGIADVVGLAADAPRVTPARDRLDLGRCDLLQVAFEISATARDALFPPGLHPVSPPVATLSFTRGKHATFGGFTVAELRLLCRSGLRTRGLHVRAFVDNASIADVLARDWAYDVAIADVTLARRYDGTNGSVSVDGRTIADAGHVSPTPIAASDLQYTASIHRGMLERGFRLLQVEREHTFELAERGTPYLRDLDAGAWGEPRVRPTLTVSASSASANVTLAPIRFALRADVPAFEGTETLAGGGPTR
jgi:hypothetical protein